MKRLFSILTLFLLISLLLTSCSSTANTGKDKDYLFSVGEKIEIFDNDSEKKLGQVTVTDVFVLSEESVRLEVDEGDTVLFRGLVQICYTYDFNDSSRHVSSGDFTVRDCKGKTALNDPDVEYEAKKTEDEYFVCAVENIGESVEIGYQFETLQPIIAWVDGNYEEAEVFQETYRPEAKDDSEDKIMLLTVICLAEGVLLLGAIITILILVRRKL